MLDPCDDSETKVSLSHEERMQRLRQLFEKPKENSLGINEGISTSRPTVRHAHFEKETSGPGTRAMTAIKEYPFDHSDLVEEANQVAAPITTPPSALSDPKTRKVSETKRKVSILTEPREGNKGYDNYGFERNRKVSSNTDTGDAPPTQRKSILHNPLNPGDNNSLHSNGNSERPPNLPERFKRPSCTGSIYSNKYNNTKESEFEGSWWYMCCKNCHQEDKVTVPSWEPPFWQKFCPYPLCPSYRHFAQIVALFTIGFLIWGVVYTLVGSTAAPGGQLFGLAALTVAAHFGGWLMFKITTLPALIGMLMVGILMQNIGLVNLEGEFLSVTSELRKFALVIILTRAGLDLDPTAMKKLFLTVLKLGLVPWTAEAVIIALMTHYLLGLPWIWAFLLGSIIAAVSPAVVVPCLFRLRGKGYGVAKGIPTLVLAVAGIDDAVSVAVFGIVHAIMFSTSSLTYTIVQGPMSIIIGIAFGVFWGYVLKYVPERMDPFVVPLRVLLLFLGGLIAVLGSDLIGWGGAGPLAVIAASFFGCLHWSKQGWEVEDNPVATAFEIFWMIFEPILFGITGAQVKINELDPRIVSIGVGCLITGVILRIFVTAGIGFRSNLNTKEKFFVGLSWMAKATVQAALGPVALDSVRNANRPQEEAEYAEIVLMICILSIVLTAPLGAIIISISGPRLLTKTRKPQVIEGWRRSHRPSIRDITIIDEEIERDGSPDQGGDNDSHYKFRNNVGITNLNEK